MEQILVGGIHENRRNLSLANGHNSLCFKINMRKSQLALQG